MIHDHHTFTRTATKPTQHAGFGLLLAFGFSAAVWAVVLWAVF